VSRSWDAASYDVVSAVMDGMAGETLDRLDLDGDEVVLDAGCGTGRITARLLERLPRGHVIAADADPDMVRKARENLPPEVEVIQADLQELDLDGAVDAVFSTATFHWVPDHDRLFARLFAALRPGGRLVAQCGGEGNIARLKGAAAEVAAEPGWDGAFDGFEPSWRYAAAKETAQRLEQAGFVDVRCWLQPYPVEPAEPVEYLRTIPLGPWIDRLPEERRGEFAQRVAERLGTPLVADYVRLNIEATRPA